MAEVKNRAKKAAKNSGKKVARKTSKKTTSETMSAKQEQFCLEYRKHEGNGTLAAIAAGYSERTAGQQAARLLKNVNIQKRIKELADDAVRKQIISLDKRAMLLSKIASNDEADVQARIRAIDVLNKMDGVYVFKAEIKVTGHVGLKLKLRKGEKEHEAADKSG